MCGYAVEWLRSCYRSTWRLFRNNADQLTEGRYYFAAPDAPHYPGWHNLGSRNWTSDERDPEPQLGETGQTPRPWDRGERHPGLIPPGLVGSPECVALGDQFPLSPADQTRELVCGIDARCWLTAGLPVLICAETHPAAGDVEGISVEYFAIRSSVPVAGDVEGHSAIAYPAPAYAWTAGDVEGASAIAYPAPAYAWTAGDVEGISVETDVLIAPPAVTLGNVEGIRAELLFIVVDPPIKP